MTLSILILICCVESLLGCVPGVKYVPPPSPSDESDTQNCRDCSRMTGSDHSRFLLPMPCCESPLPTVRLENTTDCGTTGGSGSYLKNIDAKIVGGSSALENEFPWHVALMNPNGSWRGCSAILLSCDPLIVITAAHCVYEVLLLKPLPADELNLAFGAHIVRVGESSPLDKNEVRLEVENIIIHPSFSWLTYHVGISQRNNLNITLWENDIAVIKVKKESNLKCRKNSVWPACLPRKENDYAGWDRAILSGWGRVQGKENITSDPRTLMKATLPIVGDAKCTENFFTNQLGDVFDSQLWQVYKNQLCAGDPTGGKGLCFGDSGGPLVAEDPNSEGWSAVGIVSFVSRECNTDIYGGFTEIGQYLDWIASQFGLLPPK